MSVRVRLAELITRPRGAESGGCGWTFTCFVGGVLAYGAAFAWRLLDRLDLVNLIRDVNVDDSFYYYQIAWRMAGGEFSTFDGVTRTNGYHPLWLLLITPFYWVLDKTEALFAIKAFEIMLVAGGVALVAGAARVARLPWILLFAALPALYQIEALFLGLEAAAGLFLLGLFLLAVCLFARDPARWRWPLAAVAFALPWVRLEYVAISVAVTAALCLVEWSGRFPSAPAESVPRAHRGGWRGRGRSASALNAGAPLFGAVAGLLAYCTYNALVFGGAAPVSGAAKELISERIWEQEGGYSLTENVRGFLQTGYFGVEFLVALEVCVYAALVWWFSRRSRGREDWLLLAFLVGVSGLAAGHLAKFAHSVLTVHPGASGSGMSWYFVPAYLMETLVAPVRCYVAIWFVRRFLGPKLRRASRIPRTASAASLGIVMLGAALLFAPADFTMPFRHVDSVRKETRLDSPSMRMGVTVMDRLLPKGAVVGIRDAGVTGYFSRFPVVNLDGMASSWDYLRALREGTAAAFHRRYGITHFADARPLAAGQTALFEGPSYQMRRRTWTRAVELRQFRVLPIEWRPDRHEAAERSEWFWKRMAPHLEYQEDGVGLLVDGRLAQAFARDCASGLAVWTWAGREGPVLRPWTKTSIGFCASEVVLPHDALRPVRVATMTASEYLADRIGGRRPAIDADFDVHRAGNRLVYVKQECGLEDVDARFFLRVDPVDPDDLPGPRRPHGFDNLDFWFETHGVVSGACVAEVPLPKYGIAALRTGQSVKAGGEFHPLRELGRRMIRVLQFHVETEGEFPSLWEGEIRFGVDR